jgi:hypothetical protein
MKKDFAKKSLMIMAALLCIGLILILSSDFIGEKAGTTTFQGPGGTNSTSLDRDIASRTADNYMTVGLVLSLIGGLGILVSGHALYKEL